MEAGVEMNSNPETVSTDYYTRNRLTLTVEEDVLNIINLERPDGIIAFLGQTPLKYALPIEHYLNEHKLLAASGTSPDSIEDAAEDRERFNAILNELKIEQPKRGIGKSGADVEGGNLIRTDESIINGGGGDLHFAEIISQEAGFETIMMNSNPETVSTDYDIRNRLYFETLTVEDVLNIINLEWPDGISAQFLGQTPLKLALPIEQYLNEHKLLAASGAWYVHIWGTSPDSIDEAEDRERFNAILNELKIEQPKRGIGKSGADVEGGNLIRTDESIINGGDIHLSIYQSARSGNFSYRFQSLPPGDYFVGLHFAEIISQVLSELDIYSVVEANKPLQLLDARVSVGEDVEMALSFEGVHGSPVVSRICIKRAPKPPDPLIEPEYLTNNCATETPLAQGKIKTMKREQSQNVSPPAGGLIDLQNMPKKKRKIEQKQLHHEVPISLYFLALYLATFYSPGGLSFSAIVAKDAGSRGNSSGLPPGKQKGKGLSGEKNGSLISLRYLKLRFNPKPGLDFMVLTFQWTRGFFLETIAGRLRLNGLTLQDWMLHGLWPPENASGCNDEFNRNEILSNQDFLDKLLEAWPSLKLESTNIEDHLKFWKEQWIKHGRKSRLPQQLYMELALHLHSIYKDPLNDAMVVAKGSTRSASTSYDSVLGTDICTIDTCLFTTAVSTKLGVPKLKWVDLGENRIVLKEVQLKIWFCGDDFVVGDMDDSGGSPPNLIV